MRLVPGRPNPSHCASIGVVRVREHLTHRSRSCRRPGMETGGTALVAGGTCGAGGGGGDGGGVGGTGSAAAGAIEAKRWRRRSSTATMVGGTPGQRGADPHSRKSVTLLLRSASTLVECVSCRLHPGRTGRGAKQAEHSWGAHLTSSQRSSRGALTLSPEVCNQGHVQQGVCAVLPASPAHQRVHRVVALTGSI